MRFRVDLLLLCLLQSGKEAFDNLVKDAMMVCVGGGEGGVGRAGVGDACWGFGCRGLRFGGLG